MSDDARGTFVERNEYRIEKLRCAVSVVFIVGAQLDGDMFLADRARFRSGAEEPLDVLNDGAPFFPLREWDGATILVSKAQVALVEAAVPEGSDLPARVQSGLEVQVTLSNGLVRDGTLFPEVTRERPRLLDFLNAYQEPFLAVYAGGTAFLINRQQIAHVRALT